MSKYSIHERISVREYCLSFGWKSTAVGEIGGMNLLFIGTLC